MTCPFHSARFHENVNTHLGGKCFPKFMKTDAVRMAFRFIKTDENTTDDREIIFLKKSGHW